MDDDELRDAAGNVYSYDAIKINGYLEGHAVGLDAGIGYLARAAAEAFTRGDDDSAVKLRRLATEIKEQVRPKLVTAYEEHKARYPDMLTAAGVTREPKP